MQAADKVLMITAQGTEGAKRQRGDVMTAGITLSKSRNSSLFHISSRRRASLV